MAQAGSGTLTSGPRVTRVLVVDDEENLNWSLVTSLRREQYAADGALTAEDARRRMVDVDYDCVISDIQMPGMDGFQLLNWLRAQRPQSRVIMMTAFGSPSVRQEAIRSGVAAYLEKPFDLNALKRELRKALDTPTQTASSFDLIEITQVISLSRRDVAVQARVGDQLGMLVFERGELVSAVFGALVGEQAFFAMCAAPVQLATPAPIPERVERNISQPVSALIFDALLKRDAGLAEAAPASQPVSQAPQPRLAPRPTRAPITASLVPHPPAQMPPPPSTRDPQRTVASLAAAIARPCIVALVSPDGTIRAQAQTRQPSTPEAALAHMAQGFVAFARAAQMGQWGAPREARFTTGSEQALIRLVGLRPGSPALIVVAPADIEQRQLDATIGVHESELMELTL
ncbi:MAG TPA: response regulator [Ktedonobacterales bacterium]|jgi:DNA-binding response OmpR family regulator|nr:response regulator [Ktedonobacterales bacterium]